jgi:hypothetical protein
VQDGRTLTTDGPCVAVTEALAGYLYFEADDLEAAIDPGGADSARPDGRGGGGAPGRGNSRSSSRSSATRGTRSVTSLSGLRGDFKLAEEAAEES